MNKQEVAKALQLITTDNDFRNALSKMSQNQPLFEAFTKIVLYADKKYGEGNLSEADLLVGQQGESKTNDDRNKATPSLKVPNGKYGGYIGKSSLLSGYEMPVYGKTPLKDYPITQNPWTDNWESDGLRPSPTRTANSGEDEFGLGNNGEVYSNPKNAKGVRQWKRIKWGGVNIDTISPNFNEVLRDGNFKKEDYELLLTMYVSEMRYANQEDDDDLFNKTLTRVIELDYIYYDKFDVQ